MVFSLAITAPLARRVICVVGATAGATGGAGMVTPAMGRSIGPQSVVLPPKIADRNEGLGAACCAHVRSTHTVVVVRGVGSGECGCVEREGEREGGRRAGMDGEAERRETRRMRRRGRNGREGGEETQSARVARRRLRRRVPSVQFNDLPVSTLRIPYTLHPKSQKCRGFVFSSSSSDPRFHPRASREPRSHRTRRFRGAKSPNRALAPEAVISSPASERAGSWR